MSKGAIKADYQVSGMHCAACELVVEKAISSIPEVKSVDARLSTGSVSVEFRDQVSEDEFLNSVNINLEDTAYRVHAGNSDEVSTLNKWELVVGLAIAIVLIGLFIVIQSTSLADSLLSFTNEGSLLTPFVVGVVASLSTCMAVVGGVVLSLSSKYSLDGQKLPIAQFHASRIVSFFIFGGILGLIGNTLQLTDAAIAIVNILLFFMMVIIGLNLLGVGKRTNRFQLRLPKSFGKKFLRLQESQHALVPVLLGATTFILPCGFTQAMQVQAFSTGSFIEGALTMFIFALGTLPMLALLSFASVNFANHKYSGLFFKTAGFLIIGFAVFSLLSALAILGLIAPINLVN